MAKTKFEVVAKNENGHVVYSGTKKAALYYAEHMNKFTGVYHKVIRNDGISKVTIVEFVE